MPNCTAGEPNAKMKNSRRNSEQGRAGQSEVGVRGREEPVYMIGPRGGGERPSSPVSLPTSPLGGARQSGTTPLALFLGS